jgi:hypothetical protein
MNSIQFLLTICPLRRALRRRYEHPVVLPDYSAVPFDCLLDVSTRGSSSRVGCGALELAPYGIRSIALAPTFTTTEGVAERMAATGAVGRAETFVAALPAGRVGLPDDVARVALFCGASPLAGYVTGVTIPVDGGDTAT